MGLRYYKRTKKSNGHWINTSLSNRGANASISFQSSDGKITTNIGKNGRRRVTINFGNGVKYVKQHTPKKGKGLFNWMFSKKKAPIKKTAVEDKRISWSQRLSNSLQRAADAHYEAEQERKAAAKEIKEDERKVTYVKDEEAGYTTGQKRFMLLALFVIIFAIQKCSG